VARLCRALVLIDVFLDPPSLLPRSERVVEAPR